MNYTQVSLMQKLSFPLWRLICGSRCSEAAALPNVLRYLLFYEATIMERLTLLYAIFSADHDTRMLNIESEDCK